LDFEKNGKKEKVSKRNYFRIKHISGILNGIKILFFIFLYSELSIRHFPKHPFRSQKEKTFLSINEYCRTNQIKLHQEWSADIT
jgi:hypothetical protein